jgi:serine phosphatase RsbU (regulator of sigma subunit)
MEALMGKPALLVPTTVVEWGVAARPLAGEPVSGDTYAVVPTTNGVVVAAVDGLGHGGEAADAAGIAANTVRTFAEAPVAEIVRRCHEALRRTRGAAISLASFDARSSTMSWTGIGNVEGLLVRAAPAARPQREALLLRGGVVGYSLPAPRIAKLAVASGDTLIFATDGIGGGFRHAARGDRDVQGLAAEILLHHARDHDDALVLVARYVGLG